jgi:hypothetical protein
MLQRLFTAYAAGAVAALIASLALWIAGRAELTTALEVSIAPGLTWPWLSQRMAWGGIWALPFPLLRPRRMSPVRKGLLLSLAPSAAALFYFMPEAGRGTLGRELGELTPVVVVLANALWGWALGRLLGFVEGKSRGRHR